MDVPPSIAERLAQHGQTHLLRWWPQLDDARRQALLAQLEALDFARLAAILRGDGAADHEQIVECAARAQPPSELVRLPPRGGDPAEWSRASECGETLLREGRVGAILVAGGQGTRLGFDRPKGEFPVGPLSGKSLFQLFCEQLAARSRRAGRPLPYFIMTSSATHSRTQQFFKEHAWFGLDPADVYFFQQGSLPAVDHETGRILLDRKWHVSESPDGHGGLLHALHRHGLLNVMADRGIELLYYHQVDNPAAILADPAFLGLHVLHDSEVSTKVVAKTSPDERMGVVVSVDGRTQIIEYSDLPPERAAARDADGGLRLWAGSTAMHVFQRRFLERLVREGCALPYHRACKAVPHIDEHGRRIAPAQPNACKFEQFIFDALPLARSALIVEAERSREFLPLKNRDGADSPVTVRQGLLRIARDWLSTARAVVAADARVEISPLFALDAADLADRVRPGTRFDCDTCLE